MSHRLLALISLSSLIFLGAGCSSSRAVSVLPTAQGKVGGVKQEVLVGVLATELSQIDGIKMWRLDGFGQPNKEPGTWVWVVPSLDEDPEAGPDWDGDWTYFMLHKYAGLTHERYSELDCRDTRLQVTGQELESDCGVVEGKCITIFQADKIEVLGK